MRRRRVVLFAAIIATVAMIVLLQTDLHRRTGLEWYRESMTYLPRGGRIKGALLGFETTAAHYLWIRMVLYFGGHSITDREFPWLIDMLDVITRLSPRFYPAYEFAGLMIPEICNNPEAARIILERGLTSLGARKWNIAFYMGMIYYKFYDDRKTAAEYIARAALTEGAPRRKLAGVSSALYTQAGSSEEGLQFLAFALETSDNPEVRRHLAAKIDALRKKIAAR